MRAALMALSLYFGQTGAAATATAALQARDTQVRSALPPADHVLTPAEKSKLEDLLTEAVDMPVMAKDSLGKRFATLSEAQKTRYVKAFTSRFKKATEGEIAFYRSTDITYGAETANDAGDALVPTTFTVKGEPTPIVYTVRKEGSAYKIIDLAVDGVSTVDNYRSSFGRIMDKDGIEALITKLQKEPAKQVGAK